MWSDEKQKNNFEVTGNNPIAWRMKSNDLLLSADILKLYRKKKNYQTLTSELLLRASSLENLLKALYIKKGNLIVEDGKTKFIENVKSHNLLDLTLACELTISDLEKDLLERLTFYAKDGRYPIPLKWTDQKITDLYGDGKGPKIYWKYPSDDDSYDHLRNKIIIEIENQ